MPYQLKEYSPRGDKILTPKYMNDIADDMNKRLSEMAKEANMPIRYFSQMSMDIHPLVVSAARKIRILAEPTHEFLKEIEEAYRGMNGISKYASVNIKLSCPIIWSLKQQDRIKEGANLECIAFPHLVLTYPIEKAWSRGSWSSLAMSSENPWLPRHTLGFVHQLEQELQCENRKQSWLPFVRGRRRLNTKRRLSLTRALARHVLVENAPLDAKTVDNLAQKMLDTYEPMTFHETKTLQDMRDMYTKRHSDTPGSCMDSQHGFSIDRPAEPVDWYHFCPTTKGYYVKRGNTVLARTIAYQNTKDMKWYYVRLYQTRDIYKRELQKRLENLDIHLASDTVIREIRRNAHVEFDIPMGKYGKRQSCPIPYFDMLPAISIWIKAVNNVNKCLLSPSGDKPAGSGWLSPNTASTSGAHVYGESSNTVCYHCDTDIHPDDDFIRAVNGATFCCDECASDSEYYRIQSSNNVEWQHFDDHEVSIHNIECIWEPTIFTNLNAALQSGQGVFFFTHPWADTEGLVMRSLWATNAGWGVHNGTVVDLRVFHPETGKLIVSDTGREVVRVVFLSGYEKCHGNHAQILPSGGIALKFLSIEGNHKRFDTYIHGSMSGAKEKRMVLENEGKFVKIDSSNGHSSEAVEFSFVKQYFDFMDLDKSSKTRVLSHALPAEGVTITLNQPKKENV